MTCPPPISPLDVIHSVAPPTPDSPPPTPPTSPQSPSKPSKKLSIFSPLPTLPHPPTLSLRRLLPFSPRNSPSHHPNDSDDDSEDDDDDDDDADADDDDSALPHSPANSTAPDTASTTSRNRTSHRHHRRRPRNPRQRFWPRSPPSFLTACSCWVPRTSSGLDGHEEVGTVGGSSFVDEVEFGEHLKTMSPTYEPPSPLLPAVGEKEEGRICLVLDLDETLVHSSFTPLEGADFEVALEMQGERHTVFVKKRPGVDRFLEKVSEWYEVVVFTASLALYANPVMDLLDPKRRVGLRLYREHCVMIGGCYVKDIAKLGRDLKRIVIVDNSPLSYVLQPENAIPIPAFFTDENDRELDRTLELLEKARGLKDVRKAFSQAMLR